MNKHSAMNKKGMIKLQNNKKRALYIRELPVVLKTNKAKTLLESLKMVNNEKEEGIKKRSIKLRG